MKTKIMARTSEHLVLNYGAALQEYNTHLPVTYTAAEAYL